MTNIFNKFFWNLCGVTGAPKPLDGGEDDDGTDCNQSCLNC